MKFPVDWEQQHPCSVFQSTVRFLFEHWVLVHFRRIKPIEQNSLGSMWSLFLTHFLTPQKVFSCCHCATEEIIRLKDWGKSQPWSTQLFTNEMLKMTTWGAITSSSLGFIPSGLLLYNTSAKSSLQVYLLKPFELCHYCFKTSL